MCEKILKETLKNRETSWRLIFLNTQLMNKFAIVSYLLFGPNTRMAQCKCTDFMCLATRDLPL